MVHMVHFRNTFKTDEKIGVFTLIDYDEQIAYNMTRDEIIRLIVKNKCIHKRKV